jgi:hypothetical protein
MNVLAWLVLLIIVALMCAPLLPPAGRRSKRPAALPLERKWDAARTLDTMVEKSRWESDFNFLLSADNENDQGDDCQNDQNRGQVHHAPPFGV